jgi:hypothetical protein
MARWSTVRELEVLRDTAQERAQRYEQRGSDVQYGHQNKYLARRARLRVQELSERIEIMRHATETTGTALTAPGPDWVLAVSKAGGLKIAARQYRNGEEIGADVLANCLNGDRLLSSGYVKWRSRASLKGIEPKPVAPSKPVAASPPPPPPDPIQICRAELERVAAARKCTLADAYDLVDATVMGRAIKHYVDMPKTVRSGGWGSGGGQPTQSGTGTFRRVSDGFTEYLLRAEASIVGGSYANAIASRARAAQPAHK